MIQSNSSKYRNTLLGEEVKNPFEEDVRNSKKERKEASHRQKKKNGNSDTSLRLPSISPSRGQGTPSEGDAEKKRERRKRKKEKERLKRDREREREMERGRSEQRDASQDSEEMGGTSLKEYFTVSGGTGDDNDKSIGSMSDIDGPRSRSHGDKERRRRKREKTKQKQRQKIQNDAAITLQRRIRGMLGRARYKKLYKKRQYARAKAAGVLLAVDGTVQGESGWYQQDEKSLPVYYEVLPNGQWRLVM